MNKLFKFIKRELSGWKLWHILWMVFANLIIIGISLYNNDQLISIFAAVTGVICVILCGLGKVSNYFFGIINVILYAIVSYNAKYYGEVMLNLLYYLPTNIIGWVLWEKNVKNGSAEDKTTVSKKRMTLKQTIILAIISILAVAAYSYVLNLLGGNLPIADSISTVLSVIAQILLIKRYAEQWIIWIVVDIVTIIMWFVAFFDKGNNIAMLLMWSFFLCNAVIMFIKWLKETKTTTSES